MVVGLVSPLVHSQLTSNYVGCDNKSLNGFKSNDKPICHVTSDEKGIFRFLSLPPGRYKVVPHYEGPHSINFDVKPQEMEFTVGHDSLMIDTKFEVKGFSVRGRVAMHPDGPGLEGASILLDGYLKSYTQADGVFLLENMQPGTFTLQIQANYNSTISTSLGTWQIGQMRPQDMCLEWVVNTLSWTPLILFTVIVGDEEGCHYIILAPGSLGPVTIVPIVLLLWRACKEV
ncbi:unnamed protein product [Timema podura]|uniref:NOMO third transthyretin-like domain-containing protein n=1 Tax=Timema podura TaxID=61482 RepID=A0ABN7NTB1_TIMPD|nr:unnamed protein product [Timema podura]